MNSNNLMNSRNDIINRKSTTGTFIEEKIQVIPPDDKKEKVKL